jgi:NAD(P)H dehydrogenase (quinone)
MDKQSKVLIIYSSKEGNTAGMAGFVGEGARTVADTEVRIRPVAEATLDDLYWAEGVACGSPTNMGTLSWEMKRFWDETGSDGWGKLDGRIGCAFSSSGGWGGGAELTCLTLMTVMQNFGFLTFGVTDYVDDMFTLHYGSIGARAPREERVQNSCRRLGRRLSEYVGLYFHGRKELDPQKAEYKRSY